MQRNHRIEAHLATFRVTYPWGTTYIKRLRPALRRFGVRTMNDEFVEGSDCGGFFVGPDAKSMAQARRLMSDYEKALDDDPDYDDERGWYELLDALAHVRVFEVMQDWKHFDVDPDRDTLRRFGIVLRVETRPADRDGNEVLECTLRVKAPPRLQGASRSPQPKKGSR